MRDVIGLFPSPLLKTKLQPISPDIKNIIKNLEYVKGEDGNVNVNEAVKT